MSQDFESLETAFRQLKISGNAERSYRLVERIVNEVSDQLGPISRVHVPVSRAYVAVSFAELPEQIGVYAGSSHIDHIVELPGAEPLKNSRLWRTRIQSPSLTEPVRNSTESVEKIGFPKWSPRHDSELRRQSAITIAKALLVDRHLILESHLKELLSIAVWKYTECDGKYTTRFRSVGSLRYPAEKLNHEHVVPRKILVAAILDDPSRVSEILESAVACSVLESEHRRIMDIEKTVPNLVGWNRYRAAGIQVYDLKNCERII